MFNMFKTIFKAVLTLGNIAHVTYRDFSELEIENFIGKKKDIFNMFAQNIQ